MWFTMHKGYGSMGFWSKVAKLSYKKSQRAISPIIATVIIFALILTGVLIGVLQVLPYIEQSRTQTTLATMEGSFSSIDNAITNIISGGGYTGNGITSSTQQVSLQTTFGTLSLLNVSNYFAIRNFTTSTNTLIGNQGTLVYPFESFYDSTLSFAFQTSAPTLDIGAKEYLSGPNPFVQRPSYAFLQYGTPANNYQGMSNLTLTRDKNNQYINLDYRPKIIVTLSQSNALEVGIHVYLVQLSGTIPTGLQNYQLQIKLSNIVVKTLTDTSINPLGSDIIDYGIQIRTSTAQNFQTIWDTSSLGLNLKTLNAANAINISVQVIQYQIQIQNIIGY